MGENGSRQGSSSEPKETVATVSKKRTRTGCLNCRQKRRKCDEGKPTCEGCQARHEKCRYGLKLSFRPENAQAMNRDHPSMLKSPSYGRGQTFQIVRECIEETAGVDDEREKDRIPVHSSQTHILEQDSFTPAASRELGANPPSPMVTSASSLNSAPAYDLFLSPGISESTSEDGIFVPGSQYHELHAALRSRIIDTARLSPPSAFPDLDSPSQIPTTDGGAGPADDHGDDDDEESRRLVHLPPEQELLLWENYMHEVADWLDKFDNSRAFGFKLPILAKAHPHLRYAILALSARQLERKAAGVDHSCSLALYQRAIHLLSPLLQRRTTVVLASCLVLCVLEMLSCAPKAWKRHLDGCAALIQALGISGASPGLEGALFWCFARMDVCGGLISSERTLIPLEKWIGGGDVIGDVSLLLGLEGSFDVCANHMVYLCGRVIDLLCSAGKWERRSGHLASSMSAGELTQQWSTIFWLLDQWYQERPEEMKPLLYDSAPSSDPWKPFPTVLYGNGPAVSGNQMYHTATLLILKHKPLNVQFARKPRSILWHARHICGISMSNSHHGCWTNSIQPLWIAGQHMSHASEHRAILNIYERIERETGWATRWRQDDLREYWGDVDEQVRP